MIDAKFGLCSFIFSLMLGVAPAWADVDISSKEKVEVGSWAELKAAVKDSQNAGKVIVLTGDIQADADDPISEVGGSGIIIDGGNHTITGQEGSSSGQFIDFTFSDKTDLIIQNVKINGFGNLQTVFTYGGAIYNTGTIGNITGDFSENYAKSSSSAEGGVIYNGGTINNITGNFEGNYAKSNSASAMGGAIINSIVYDPFGYIEKIGIIKNISAIFSNNYVNAKTNAQGGAIANYGTMTLTNSSFFDNYVQTSAMRDSIEGQMTFGGAIASEGDLTIRADNSESIFRGNKVIWGDSEDSSAITMLFNEANMMSSNLTLDSRNNGLIQFDDKISTFGIIDYFIWEYTGLGATITDDGNGGYIIEYNGKQIYLKKDNGMLWVTEEQDSMEKDEVEEMLSQIEQIGGEVVQEGENYFATATVDGISYKYEFVKQDDGTYLVTGYEGYSAYGANMVITGDNSSKVVFNNKLDGIGTIDISGTNVDVNEGAGTIYRTVTHDGGVLNINAGAKAEDSIVNDKGTLHVASGGMAENTTVNSGGSLVADNDAKVNNMLANDGANLDIDAGSILTGDIVIHAGATMGGSFDYSQIFKDEVADSGSLTLVGGLNNALNESSLINTTTGKKLHLTDGSYVIGDGAQAVNGWDLLTLQNNATVKLEGDVTLTGPTKKMIIENGSE